MTTPATSSPTTRGSFSYKDEIRAVVRSHIGEVSRCYNAGLARDPSLHGRVVVVFKIGPRGGVKSSRVTETEVHDGRVERCIVSMTRAWRFPPRQGAGNTVVTYPFLLEVTAD